MMNTFRVTGILAWAVLAAATGSGMDCQSTRPTDGEIEFVWKLVDRDARSSVDAGFLLYVLYRHNGNAIRQGWDKFGCGHQWLDWWLVVRPRPRRALGADDYFAYLYLTNESEMHAVADEPDILGRIVSARLFELGVSLRARHGKEPLSIRTIKDNWLYWELNADLTDLQDREIPSTYGWYDSDDGHVHYLPVWVNRLRWCYWLFGRRGEVRAVTDLTWKHDYMDFRRWLTENEAFLRFDKEKLQFEVDQDAKRQARAVPQEARLIPVPATPFSDWNGPTPDAYE